MFASLISAVDPVATLGVFGAMGVHPKLNAFVYGESILNDLVAIVAYKPTLGTRARRNSVFLGPMHILDTIASSLYEIFLRLRITLSGERMRERAVHPKLPGHFA